MAESGGKLDAKKKGGMSIVEHAASTASCIIGRGFQW